MTGEDLLELCARQRAIPIVRVTTRGLAGRAGRWCRDEGFAVVEITMTCPDALEVIGALAKEPDVIVGAGTVLSRSQAEAAIAAGAAFIVTPAGVPDLQDGPLPAPLIAGAFTPTEIWARRAEGAVAVKVFPVRQAGGPAYLNAVRQVFPHIPRIPTGGVTVEDAGHYLAAGALAVGLGGDLVDPALLEADDRRGFAERAARLRAALGR